VPVIGLINSSLQDAALSETILKPYCLVLVGWKLLFVYFFKSLDTPYIFKAVPCLRNLVAGLSMQKTELSLSTTYVGFVADEVETTEVLSPPSTYVFVFQYHFPASMQFNSSKANAK
jgi:hypothetical protein